jgi:hypothetical protein
VAGADTATGEVAQEQPATTTEQSGYDAGYRAGYIFCDGQPVSQVAEEFEVAEEPKAAAEGFAASFDAEQREGAYEGCYDGLLGKPSESRLKSPKRRRPRHDCMSWGNGTPVLRRGPAGTPVPSERLGVPTRL